MEGFVVTVLFNVQGSFNDTPYTNTLFFSTEKEAKKYIWRMNVFCRNETEHFCSLHSLKELKNKRIIKNEFDNQDEIFKFEKKNKWDPNYYKNYLTDEERIDQHFKNEYTFFKDVFKYSHFTDMTISFVLNKIFDKHFKNASKEQLNLIWDLVKKILNPKDEDFPETDLEDYKKQFCKNKDDCILIDNLYAEFCTLYEYEIEFDSNLQYDTLDSDSDYV